MKIHSASASQIKAAVAFPYRGYTISVSNIFAPSETAIFDKENAFARDKDGAVVSFPANVEGIIAAKEFIDAVEG